MKKRPKVSQRDLAFEHFDYLCAVEDAARALVFKLEEVSDHPAFKSVWTLAMIHGGTYDGPNYGEELKAVKNLLKTKYGSGRSSS